MRARILLLICFAMTAQAEVIDRIVANVDGHIITLSDIRQEREIRALLGEKPIVDDAALAKQLTDSYLVEKQITNYPNIDVTDAEVQEALQKFDRRDGIIPERVREAVRQRIRVQKFFVVKFRESIRPTDDEIRKYYEDVFVPEAKKRGVSQVPPLSDTEMTAAVRENVIQERLDHEVGLWLDAIRRRSKIEILR